MKILLILFVAGNFLAGLGSPVEYQRESFETGRNPNIQVTQNLTPEELKASREHYQTSRSNNQPTRQEYRRFVNDASAQSTQGENPTAGFNTNERKTSQNQNSEVQTPLSNRNQVSQFPPVSESTQVQKSSFRNQDLTTDTLFPYTPVSQIQNTLSTQETHRSGSQNADDQISITSVHSQGISQKGTPFGMERRSEIQTGMYQSNFGPNFPRMQDQISQTEEAAFQNQNNFRSPVEDQRFQSQQTFYQNVGRGDYPANQGQQLFPQRPALVNQDQSSQRPQEQFNQVQNTPQQNERSSVPAPFYERDSFYNQGQVAFDSRRISPAPVSQQIEHASGDDNKYFPSSSQFPRSQPSEKSQNRQNSGIKTVTPFEDNKQSQTDGSKQNVGNTHDNRQGFFHAIDQNQPALIVPELQQTSTPVLVSGTKGSPAVPVMVYKTGSAASPHAVVLGQDLTVINKASVSHHLQTPFTQYTYAHPL